MTKSGNKKGFRHTEKTKEKISKNNARYWLGKKRPKMNGNKFSLALVGRKRPPEVIEKIIQSMPRGEKHHNWKGGATSIRERIWHRPEYKNWRDTIFQRDNFRCVLCNKKSGVLNADHFPKSLREILKEEKIDSVEKARRCKKLWDTKNGRTLCLTCHRQTPTYGFPKTKKWNKNTQA